MTNVHHALDILGYRVIDFKCVNWITSIDPLFSYRRQSLCSMRLGFFGPGSNNNSSRSPRYSSRSRTAHVAVIAGCGAVGCGLRYVDLS